MAKPDQTTRTRILAGWVLATTGDLFATEAPCPVCTDPMTYDVLSTPEVAGMTLGHYQPRNGDSGSWTISDVCPVCTDCNDAARVAGNVAQPADEMVESGHRAILATDYRVSAQDAQTIINRNRAVIEGRKAAKAAKRAEQGKQY